MLEQLNSFIALWVMIDPIAALPIFVGITGEFDRCDRRKTAVVAIVASFLILCFFIAVGKIILEAMGVSLRDFQIAGGLILFLFAASMVMGDGQEGPEPRANYKNASALAIYPLAVPTLAGPGAMLTVMLLTDNSRFTIMDQLLTTATLALASPADENPPPPSSVDAIPQCPPASTDSAGLPACPPPPVAPEVEQHPPPPPVASAPTVGRLPRSNRSTSKSNNRWISGSSPAHRRLSLIPCLNAPASYTLCLV